MIQEAKETRRDGDRENDPISPTLPLSPSPTPAPETGRALREEYEQGAGMKELARRYGMSLRAVNAALIRQGTRVRKQGRPAGHLCPNHHNRKLPVGRIPELLALCDAGGLTLGVIGERLGLSRQRVSQIARAHGRSRA